MKEYKINAANTFATIGILKLFDEIIKRMYSTYSLVTNFLSYLSVAIYVYAYVYIYISIILSGTSY